MSPAVDLDGSNDLAVDFKLVFAVPVVALTDRFSKFVAIYLVVYVTVLPVASIPKRLCTAPIHIDACGNRGICVAFNALGPLWEATTVLLL